MNTIALAALLQTALATPWLSYPFNNQLPPVARWGKAFSYTFSPDTFRSNAGSITYTSNNLPSWLSLNGRTLSGNPADGNGDQQIHFTLIATDESGSAQEDCFLQLSDSGPPTYSSDELEDALRASGAIASPNSYVLMPNEQFEIEFPSNFFTSDGRSVIGHYSVQTDHSPLPIWLNFDGGAGKYSGRAPAVNSQIAQAQQFSILYIISTFQGFESASAEFNLLLGANVLAMNISRDEVNATVGQYFSYGAPMSQVTLNNEPITTSNLSAAKASIPEDARSWLNWDSSNFTLSGTPPQGAAGNYTVGIEIVDKYNDAVSWDVAIEVANKTDSTVFKTSSLPAANATRGKWFEYDLGDYVLNKNIDLSIAGPAKWLTVHSSNFSINGKVPSDFDSALINITATPKEADGKNRVKRATDDDNESLTAHLEIYGVGPRISSSSSASSRSSSMSRTSSRPSSSSMSRSSSLSHSHSRSSSYRSISATSSSPSSSGASSTTTRSSTSSSTSSATPLAAVSKSTSSSTGVAVGCGVGISLGLLALAALLLFCFCRRRRRQRAAAASNLDYGGGGAVEKVPSPPGSGDSTFDTSQISAPRPTSKGMAMAPVFRTGSASDSDEFEDALEYPGELGDDRTVFGTPDKEKEIADASWNSPQRASTLNFLAMDGSSSQSSLPMMGPVGGDDTATLATLNPTTSHELGPPEPHEDDDIVGDIPRESWRHTNTGERRWQDARFSRSSLASIVPTEPPTVQLASDEFEPSQPQAALLPREYSSGVLHRIGSHSSSQYTDSRYSASTSHRISGHYRSDSGSQNSQEFSDSSSGGANFRSYRDENGELHWRQEAAGVTSARLNDVGLDRKPSAAKTPRGDQGEFVFV